MPQNCIAVDDFMERKSILRKYVMGFWDFTFSSHSIEIDHAVEVGVGSSCLTGDLRQTKWLFVVKLMQLMDPG